jgi:hypothetical protein
LRGYWIEPPDAAKLVGLEAGTTLLLRWFRQELDATPLPDLAPGELVRKDEFSKFTDLDPKLIHTNAEAQSFMGRLDVPVPASGFIVTVDDVAAVAKGEEPESE